MKEAQSEFESSSEERGALRKVTITLPQDVYERLIQESARRRIAGESNKMLSAVIREAVTKYLDKSY